MKLHQVFHGVHVIPQCQAELVFGVALPLKHAHHLLYRRTPPADAAETLPQPQCQAPQRVLHKCFALREKGEQWVDDYRETYIHTHDFPPPHIMFYCNHVFISNSLFYQIQRLLFSFFYSIIDVHVWFIIFSVIYKVLWVGLSSMKVLRKQKQFVTALNQGVYLKYCLGNKTIFIHSPWFLEAEK